MSAQHETSHAEAAAGAVGPAERAKVWQGAIAGGLSGPPREQFLWWRVLGLVTLVAAITAAGVLRVREHSAGIRLARDLAQADAELREAVERNRDLEALVERALDPVLLREEAVTSFGMDNVDPDDLVEVP